MGSAHQHDHADVLLRDLRRPAARRGDRAHQEVDREDLRQARAGGGAAQLRGRSTRRSRTCTRSPCPHAVSATHAPSAARLRAGARLRAEDHRGDAGRQGRPAAGQRASRSTAPGRSATAKWEKRNLALEIPVWDAKVCIQCNQCALVCPHAAIRAKVYDDGALAERAADVQVDAPTRATSTRASSSRSRWRRRTAPAATCASTSARPRTAPTRSTRRSTCTPQAPLRDAERANYDFFLDLPELDRTRDARASTTRRSQFLEPLFEYSGACAGCGETPYLKLLTQLFGDRAADRQRHRLLVDLRRQPADDAVHDQPRRPRAGVGELAVRGQRRVRPRLPAGARRARRGGARPASSSSRRSSATTLATRAARRRPVDGSAASPRSASAVERAAATARPRSTTAEARRLETLADYLGEEERVAGRRRRLGLRHRLRRPRPRARPASRDVNILVLDTEVYSNTGGQAVEGDAARRRRQVRRRRQDDRQEGSRPAGEHVRPRLRRARRLRREDGADRRRRSSRPRRIPGPSLIIAYSHCIAHGYDMAQGAAQQKLAVDSGVLAALPLRSAPAPSRASRRCTSTTDRPRRSVADYMRNESRFRMVERADPARYKAFVAESQAAAERRYCGLSAARRDHGARSMQQTEASRPNPPRRRSDGPQHDLSRDAAAASADRRRGPARRRPRTVARALEDAGAALLVLRSLYEEEITGEQMDDVLQRRKPQRLVRRGGTAIAPEPLVALGPDEYLEHLAARSRPRSAFR